MNARFPDAEFAARLARTQDAMADSELDALVLTGAADICYYTGFLTRFWESPTRPWFVILPAAGGPVAVIPTIGAPLMAATWVRDIRTWRSPDARDDGISLLADTLAELTPRGGRVGVPSGAQTHLRMPLDDWAALRARLADRDFGSDTGIVTAQRQVKSETEIARVRASCAVADAAFARVPEIAAQGVALSDLFRRFQMLCLEGGADWVGYLAGGAGPGGYGDVIAPATDAPLAEGDVLMLDTGVLRAGYYCDFDRNWSIGPPARDTADAYARLIAASDAAFDIARPGVTAAEVFHVMDMVLTGGAGGSDAGRYGHGLGLQLTEGASLIPDDHTELVAGMVLTLEPGITLDAGRGLVHEENIVITAQGAQYLSSPAPRTLPVL